MEKDSIDWQKMEKWSGAMFGSAHRLPVAVVALELDAEADGIYAEAVKERLGFPSSIRATEHLNRLVDAKLLKPPRKRRVGGRGRPRKVYAKSDDEFWDCLTNLVERRFTAGDEPGE